MRPSHHMACGIGSPAADLDLNQTGTGRSVAISGYEDHALEVQGSDHVVTDDDSNVFIARDGQINAKTGDTDSSGLNVVDVSERRPGTRHIGGDGYDDLGVRWPASGTSSVTTIPTS
jgi:hypothetical protein